MPVLLHIIPCMQVLNSAFAVNYKQAWGALTMNGYCSFRRRIFLKYSARLPTSVSHNDTG